MALRLFLFMACLFLGQQSIAQDNWKKASKSADQLFATGNYEEAANYYLEAYKQKNSKTEFLYNAANCYEKLRFYNKASNLYKELVGNKSFPKAQLQYARALKQHGEYTEAISAFKSFLVNYKGDDSGDYLKIIKTEIEGCEYALASTPSDTKWTVEHLSEGINTIADEVAPLPFNDEILYFSSTMEGFAKIYRSQFQAGEWSEAVLPNFPKFKDQHACHGTFTPDNQRFYFTLCSNTEFDAVDTQCDLYVTVRKNSEWMNPRKLRDYIKLEGSTATHPFVMHEGDMEILYFSSDRKGGKGGMDIWFMTRHVDSPEYDFTLPKNAGDNINTKGDEITPYYNANDGVMYFSSNGHASIGGFDIFKSIGSMSKFSSPQNLGAPINSSADDYYFVENKSQTGGFLSSNRLFGSEKITTDNDDIFFFSVPEQDIFARGNVYNKSNNSIINDAQVILYEVKDSGTKRLLQSIIANNGTYQFSLIPERAFEIEVIKEGYETSTTTFNTFAFDANKEYGKSIYLEQESLISKVEEPVFKESSSTVSMDVYTPPAEPEVEEKPTVAIAPSTPVNIEKPVYSPPINYINSYYKGMAVTTSAPKLDGTYYKVQISTQAYFNESDSMYDSVRDFGSLQTEDIFDKGWTRILLSEYFSLSEAKMIMEDAREAGFPEAFVVKYRNGDRKN